MAQELETPSVFDLFREIGAERRLDIIETLYGYTARDRYLHVSEIQERLGVSGKKRWSESDLLKDLEALRQDGWVDYGPWGEVWRLSWGKVWFLGEINEKLYGPGGIHSLVELSRVA